MGCPRESGRPETDPLTDRPSRTPESTGSCLRQRYSGRSGASEDIDSRGCDTVQPGAAGHDIFQGFGRAGRDEAHLRRRHPPPGNPHLLSDRRGHPTALRFVPRPGRLRQAALGPFTRSVGSPRTDSASKVNGSKTQPQKRRLRLSGSRPAIHALALPLADLPGCFGRQGETFRTGFRRSGGLIKPTGIGRASVWRYEGSSLNPRSNPLR